VNEEPRVTILLVSPWCPICAPDGVLHGAELHEICHDIVVAAERASEEWRDNPVLDDD
jgi:hypothetical protein